jgi:hypothetical protein
MAVSAAQAALITNTPADAQANGVAQSPPFGPLAASGTVGTSLIGFGVDYSFGHVEGYFSDPPFAFCGINAAGVCDLLTAVDARIVLTGTQTQGLTSFVQIEAGYFDGPGNGTLSVFDVAGNLLETANGSGHGASGRDLFTISHATADIASFSMSGADAYGVNRVTITTPTGAAAAAAVPAPASIALVALGLLALRGSRRRQA